MKDWHEKRSGGNEEKTGSPNCTHDGGCGCDIILVINWANWAPAKWGPSDF